MTELFATAAYVGGGLALGLLIEMPIYNAITATREKYIKAVKKADRSALQ